MNIEFSFGLKKITYFELVRSNTRKIYRFDHFKNSDPYSGMDFVLNKLNSGSYGKNKSCNANCSFIEVSYN